MAQVTMDSKEYLELVDKARRLEKIEKAMVEGVHITLDPERAYSKFHIATTTVFTAEAKALVVERVIDEIKDVTWLMDHLEEENKHFLNLVGGCITSHWDDKPEHDELDLFTNKAFKKAWDEAVKRREASEAISQSLLEEEE